MQFFSLLFCLLLPFLFLSQLYLCDLAGSERLRNNTGKRAKETMSINKSLHVLTKVIVALARRSQARQQQLSEDAALAAEEANSGSDHEPPGLDDDEKDNDEETEGPSAGGSPSKSDRDQKSLKSRQGRLKSSKGSNFFLLTDAEYCILTISCFRTAIIGRGRKIYVPFRESKLTRMLQNALGGNSNTSIICTLDPYASQPVVRAGKRRIHLLVLVLMLSVSALSNLIQFWSFPHPLTGLCQHTLLCFALSADSKQGSGQRVASIAKRTAASASQSPAANRRIRSPPVRPGTTPAAHHFGYLSWLSTNFLLFL